MGYMAFFCENVIKGICKKEEDKEFASVLLSKTQEMMNFVAPMDQRNHLLFVESAKFIVKNNELLSVESVVEFMKPRIPEIFTDPIP